MLIPWSLSVKLLFFFLMLRRPPRSNPTDTPFPSTPLFRSVGDPSRLALEDVGLAALSGRASGITIERVARLREHTSAIAAERGNGDRHEGEQKHRDRCRSNPHLRAKKGWNARHVRRIADRKSTRLNSSH